MYLLYTPNAELVGRFSTIAIVMCEYFHDFLQALCYGSA